MPQLAYITPDDQMQIINVNYDGSIDVYNFLSIYSEAHSHIHYDKNYNKTIYRTLENPEYDTHKFYPKPEDLQYSAIQRDSVYDFDFMFEQLISTYIDKLDIEQLIELKESLRNIKNNNILVRKK